MFRSLYSRLAAVLVLVLGAVAALALTVTWQTTTRYQQEVAQRLNLELADHIVAETHLMDGGRINEKALKGLFNQLMVWGHSMT